MRRAQLLSLTLALASSVPCAADPRIHEPAKLSGETGAALRTRMADVVLLAPRDALSQKDGQLKLRTESRTGLCSDQQYAQQRGVGTQAAHNNSAYLSTVCTASSCRSGG